MAEIVIPHSQYADPIQQRETATMGMWIFLATEVMFFGGLFTAFTLFSHLYPEAFADASRHCDFWLGAGNTVVLLCSSLSMALAVHAARSGQQKALTNLLLLTMILGIAFLGLKGVEYWHHIHDHLLPGRNFVYDPRFGRQTELFFYLYFVMTGLHAIHMLGGLGVLATLIVMNRLGKLSASYDTPVELAGLYWHFVDIIWIFLFPMFYLLGGH